MALVVDDGVPVDRVADVLAGAGGELLESVTLFDVYRGAACRPAGAAWPSASGSARSTGP